MELPEVRRALGVTALEENERLMEEATALAEIIGDVRPRLPLALLASMGKDKSFVRYAPAKWDISSTASTADTITSLRMRAPRGRAARSSST